MADKGFDRRAKDVTVGTPTPNPTCKIFLPKFEISISDKKKKGATIQNICLPLCLQISKNYRKCWNTYKIIDFLARDSEPEQKQKSPADCL